MDPSFVCVDSLYGVEFGDEVFYELAESAGFLVELVVVEKMEYGLGSFGDEAPVCELYSLCVDLNPDFVC